VLATETVVPVTLDVNGFFEHMAGRSGLARRDVEAIADRTEGLVRDLNVRRARGELPFFGLPYDEALHAEVGALATSLRESFSTLIVLGIGGSALGTKAVTEALSSSPRGMRVTVLDNIDPATVSRVLASVDLERTAFNVISKSGDTAETMAQFLIVRERLAQTVGTRRMRDHVVVTTDARRGALRAIAEKEGFRTLSVPDGVGGRFSVLSAVGLLPIAAAGFDVASLTAGARSMDVRTNVPDLWRNPAALHAALLYLALTARGAAIHVLMPYCDGLLRMAEWYGQLWAESLGKRRRLDGTVAETGQTPVRALGATDQHSQVQLYMEGPRDKVVTFLRVERHSSELEIPSAYGEHESLGYLAGHSLGDLINMEQRATELALAADGRLASVVVLAQLDEAALGQIFHLFAVQTLVMAGLLGVDALDQPGVEAGKRMTRAMAGHPGYRDAEQAVQAKLAAKRDDLVLS
jgi:glucose-6-phosphate isomerase